MSEEIGMDKITLEYASIEDANECPGRDLER